jgi:hypothetical protein
MREKARNVVPLAPVPHLHCLWTAFEDENGVHLMAHWSGGKGPSADAPFGKEGESCWRTTLYFVWDSHSFSAP